MPTKVKAEINPALISWARDTAGFTVAEAAKKLGIEEERLVGWEQPAADDGPSIPQLRKLAALFKRPLAVFYLSEPPKNFTVKRHTADSFKHWYRFRPVFKQRCEDRKYELSIESSS
jgi:transcriptional regulator with XRE-family HTH domain